MPLLAWLSSVSQEGLRYIAHFQVQSQVALVRPDAVNGYHVPGFQAVHSVFVSRLSNPRHRYQVVYVALHTLMDDLRQKAGSQ